jgi:CelD/BcsL family acetyltransferase involved in cellulose biosynthesis
LAISTPARSAGIPVHDQALTCRPLALDAIPRAAWDRLLGQTAGATPFARWTVHRAWWDAYGATAHDQYMVTVPAGTPVGAERDTDQIRGIVPLMHRHSVEPQDQPTATVLRRHVKPLAATAVRADAKAIFFGAAYHTDYMTLLAAPADLPTVAAAVADALAGPPDASHGSQPWDVVDLRRLRSDDPALPALERAFRDRASAAGWLVTREPEDVCPVVSAPAGGWDDYLATLDKKARHEIRRKWRRAEGAGELRTEVAPPTAEGIAAFIELHQARFGADGLFPATEGGRRSRLFVERLAELERAEPSAGQLRLAQVSSGGSLLFAALAFDDGTTCFLYNAGMDPTRPELSPGIVGTAAYIRDRLAAGRRRFDFLRGDEPYKYEWGARDEVIERLLVTRTATE